MENDLPIAIVIRSNPIESHRPAEALRVAIGLSGGEPEKINIILIDSAPALLYHDPWDLEDGETFEQHLDAMLEYGMIFNVEESYVQQEGGPEETDFEVKIVSVEDVSKLIAQSSKVLVF
ncbi:MAG: hypothetical protein JSV84_17080 [Gemmatimonadota bacterium]|nr:MAG: hypothetical protein JSV84_17080 [Gemmatimonadota bacterium]